MDYDYSKYVHTVTVNRPNGFPVLKKHVQIAINQTLKELELKLEALDVNFVDDAKILEINKEFLQHDYITDIITFDYSETEGMIEGELFICYEEAERNAQLFNVSYEVELLRLIIHGVLHLAGYDDMTDADRAVMKEKEDYLTENLKFVLKRYGTR